MILELETASIKRATATEPAPDEPVKQSFPVALAKIGTPPRVAF
jgi:hypothetical protein